MLPTTALGVSIVTELWKNIYALGQIRLDVKQPNKNSQVYTDSYRKSFDRLDLFAAIPKKVN